MSYTDRELLKQQQAGALQGTTASAAVDEVGHAHSAYFTWEVTADAAVAERGFIVPRKARIKEAKFCPSSSLAADGTNYVTQLIQVRDGAGGAAATAGTLDTNSAGGNVSLTAFEAGTFTLTNANLDCAAGSVVTFKSTETGAPATPVGLVYVKLEWV
jgi:hypothetical protein